MKHALVVDDHPIVRDGVKELLQSAFPSIAVKASSGNHGVLQEICGHPWAFVVLDIGLPRQNGIDVIKKAKACCPDIPIVVFSIFSEDQYAARALRAGASAYLSKDRSPLDLVDAVKLALQGGPAKRPGKALAQPVLSDREIQVLNLFAKGMSRKEISQTLHIDGKTVSTYRARLQQKLGLRNLVDLFRYAEEHGLVD
jgi:DNA-binding NarL/FixJ family response regulator